MIDQSRQVTVDDVINQSVTAGGTQGYCREIYKVKTIGTAQLMIERVYETPYSPDYPVIVKPGTYDICELDESIFLNLKGYKLRPVGFEKLWEDETGATFLLNPKDTSSDDILINVIPKLWSIEEFQDFCAEDICKKGLNQRWKISLVGGVK